MGLFPSDVVTGGDQNVEEEMKYSNNFIILTNLLLIFFRVVDKYFVILYNYDPCDSTELVIEDSDIVYVQFEQTSRYYGYTLRNQDEVGFFPKTICGDSVYSFPFFLFNLPDYLSFISLFFIVPINFTY
jgi:hypothetical protein